MSEVSTQLWGIFFSGTKDIPNYICKKNQYGKNCPVKEHSFNLTQSHNYLLLLTISFVITQVNNY